MNKPRITQRHHVSYKPEWTVAIYKGEHECLTKLHLYSKKTLSRGLITALLQFIQDNYQRAIVLGPEEKK